LKVVGFLHILVSGFCRYLMMRRRNRKTLRDKIEALIARRGDDVFLTREFGHLGGEDQIIRALRELVREGRLIKLGYGVYARAEQSSLSGRPVLAARNGFVGASREALTKLGVEWEPTEAERALHGDRFTHVPANSVVRVKGRFARRLGYGSSTLVVERRT
jgi:hypothetical protein